MLQIKKFPLKEMRTKHWNEIKHLIEWADAFGMEPMLVTKEGRGKPVWWSFHKEDPFDTRPPKELAQRVPDGYLESY